MRQGHLCQMWGQMQLTEQLAGLGWPGKAGGYKVPCRTRRAWGAAQGWAEPPAHDLQESAGLQCVFNEIHSFLTFPDTLQILTPRQHVHSLPGPGPDTSRTRGNPWLAADAAAGLRNELPATIASSSSQNGSSL